MLKDRSLPAVMGQSEEKIQRAHVERHLQKDWVEPVVVQKRLTSPEFVILADGLREQRRD